MKWILIVGLVVILAVGTGASAMATEQNDSPDVDDGTIETNDPPLGRSVDVTLTGYWPFTARPDEQRMEGGVNDRKGNPLHTLQDHISDPVAHPYVSLSGDYTLFAYGQRVVCDGIGVPDSDWIAKTGLSHYVCRIVDTGSHFFGVHKVIAYPGYEPIDVCVQSSSDGYNRKQTTMYLIEGDTL